jgi:DNA-binding transcriptional regulator YdaS (Cro superfamily)
MTRIHDRIRKILDSNAALTQRGLAEKMGLNPAAVNRMLHGRRNIMAEEVPIIEQYLGQKLDMEAENTPLEFQQGRRFSAPRGFSDITQPPLTDVNAFVPVYACETGVRKVIDWVQRHPAQTGIAEAFAVYVPADDMAPRYFMGELVYIHPGRPAAGNADCLIETTDGEWRLRRLVSQDPVSFQVQYFSPPREEKIPRSAIKAIYMIVGRA